ncbi:hypothetical protein GCM10010191_44590 [Actinomadura vinacea]|uniref:PPE domain-containing protein n=1 Tax=Actinomadura vinacea TaxID=115336 RepID=A0ABN3JCF4_9ACTN
MSPPPAPSGGPGGQQQIRQDVGGASDGIGGWNSLKIWEDQFDKLKELVDAMRPGTVKTAGEKYTGMSNAMYDSVSLLHNQSYKIIEAWGGDDARQAMEQMNKAYRAALEVYEKGRATGQALTTHAQTQTQWQQAYGSGSATDSWVREVARWGAGPLVPASMVTSFLANNMGAGEAMHQVNVGTEQSNDRFPEGIRQDMPQTNPNVRDNTPGPPDTPGGPGSPKMPGGGPGGGPGGMPSGPEAGDLPKGGVPQPPEYPGGPDGPGGPDIPGGPGGGPGGIPGGGGVPGGGPGGLGSDLASMPGGGPGGGAGGGLGGGAPGGMPGGGPGGGLGSAGGGPGAVPAGAFGKGGMGAGGMPMGMPMGAGGGAGGNDNERERSTWLTEDEDVWGGNDDTTPPVIGA